MRKLDPLAQLAFDLLHADCEDFLRTGPGNAALLHYDGILEQIEAAVHAMRTDLAARALDNVTTQVEENADVWVA